MKVFAGFGVTVHNDRNRSLRSCSSYDCSANAFGSAGDEHDLIFELQVHCSLANKDVLVTGGAKGIGAAIVRAAAAEAAVPVIVDRDGDPGKQLHAEFPISHLIVADLSSPADCQTAVSSTVEGLGRLDSLGNNAVVND